MDLKGCNPDKGPVHYDKGYQTDGSMLNGAYPDTKERGNRYFDLQNAQRSSDAKKLKKQERRKY